MVTGGLARPREASLHSDVEFLVVEPEVANEAEESVRFHRTLRDLRMPADVIVVSRVRMPGSSRHRVRSSVEVGSAVRWLPEDPQEGVAAGQMAPNPDYDSVKVVDVGTVPLGLGGANQKPFFDLPSPSQPLDMPGARKAPRHGRLSGVSKLIGYRLALDT